MEFNVLRDDQVQVIKLYTIGGLHPHLPEVYCICYTTSCKRFWRPSIILWIKISIDIRIFNSCPYWHFKNEVNVFLVKISLSPQFVVNLNTTKTLSSELSKIKKQSFKRIAMQLYDLFHICILQNNLSFFIWLFYSLNIIW